MDLTFSEEDFAFQKEVRQWIKENYPEEMRMRHKRSANGTLDKAPPQFRRTTAPPALRGLGWAKQPAVPNEDVR